MPFTETSYQTAPLVDYSPAFRDRAASLFDLLSDRVGQARAKAYKGSFSLIAVSSDATAAKIVIYEDGKGKVNGIDPFLVDGVYVLIRVQNADAHRTIGVAPKHDERFAYFRLADDQTLEEMAHFMAACADSQ